MKNKRFLLNSLLICRKNAPTGLRRAAHPLARGSGAIAITNATEANLARILRLMFFGDRSRVSSIDWASVR